MLSIEELKPFSLLVAGGLITIAGQIIFAAWSNWTKEKKEKKTERREATKKRIILHSEIHMLDQWLLKLGKAQKSAIQAGSAQIGDWFFLDHPMPAYSNINRDISEYANLTVNELAHLAALQMNLRSLRIAEDQHLRGDKLPADSWTGLMMNVWRSAYEFVHLAQDEIDKDPDIDHVWRPIMDGLKKDKSALKASR